MYCPRCGQQQATEQMRFCSRCGFPLTVISEVMAQGGVAAVERQPPLQPQKISPRGRGIRHGAMLMLSTLLVVPTVIFLILLSGGSEKLIPLLPLSAVLCFVGGLLRIFYALMFEESAPPLHESASIRHAHDVVSPAQLHTEMRGQALPPAGSVPVNDWQSPVGTAEIVRPPSVTENTTKLLARERDSEG